MYEIPKPKKKTNEWRVTYFNQAANVKGFMIMDCVSKAEVKRLLVQSGSVKLSDIIAIDLI